MTWLSVDLPEPFGPMMACTSPLFTVSESPWRISRSSTRTCRFLTSSNGITFFRFFSSRGAPKAALSNRTFEADRDQLLRFPREFHRQLLQHVLDKAVDHEADRLFLAQPALHAIEQDVFRNLRRRGLVLEQRRGILGLHIRHRMGAAFVADQKRVTGGEIARAGRL